MTQETEDVLRAALASRAAQIGTAPPSLAQDAMDEAGRPWRPGPTVLLAGAAASVIAVVVVAMTLLSGSGDSRPAEPSPSASAPGTTAATTLAYEPGFDPYPFPPRGDLAGDPTIVQQLLTRPWGTGGYFGPALETRQVVFAGTVDGEGVQSLVIGRDADRWLGLWAAGSSVGDLQVMGDAQPVDVSAPIVWSNSVDGVGALVVITALGDQVEVSQTAELGADGAATRTWEPLPTIDGIASRALDASGVANSQVRVTRDGAVVFQGGMQGSAAIGGQPPAEGGENQNDVLAAAVLGARGNPDSTVVSQALFSLTYPLQLTATELGAGVIWGGQIQGDGRAVALQATVPSGAHVVTVQVGWPPEQAEGGDELSGGEQCATQVFPATTDVAATVLATQCDHYDLQGALVGSTQVVVPPADTRSLRFLDANGLELSTATVQDGVVWSGPLIPGLASVEALDAAGTVLADDPLMTNTNLYDQ